MGNVASDLEDRFPEEYVDEHFILDVLGDAVSDRVVVWVSAAPNAAIVIVMSIAPGAVVRKRTIRVVIRGLFPRRVRERCVIIVADDGSPREHEVEEFGWWGVGGIGTAGGWGGL